MESRVRAHLGEVRGEAERDAVRGMSDPASGLASAAAIVSTSSGDSSRRARGRAGPGPRAGTKEQRGEMGARLSSTTHLIATLASVRAPCAATFLDINDLQTIKILAVTEAYRRMLAAGSLNRTGRRHP
jgi:hypothetical protein